MISTSKLMDAQIFLATKSGEHRNKMKSKCLYFVFPSLFVLHRGFLVFLFCGMH